MFLGRFWRRLVACFLAGVFAVLPVAITIAIVIWVTDFLRRFIGPETVLGNQLRSLGLNFATNRTTAYVAGWILVLTVVFLLGVLIEMGAKRLIQRLIDALLNRVPLVGSIYTTSKQIVGMLNKKDEANLKGMSAVFCQFGQQSGAGVLALLVSPARFRINETDYHIVIVPTAPVPFGGGLLFMPVDWVRPADMSVDGLMSIYVSMGVTAPRFLGEAS